MPIFSLFFFNDPATTELYTLSLHDALPISSITLFDQTLQLTPSTTPTPPVAELASPFDGQNIRDVDLNAAKHIDVLYTSPGGTGINAASVTGSAPKITLTGHVPASLALSSAS